MNRVAQKQREINPVNIPVLSASPEYRTDTNAALWQLIDEQCEKYSVAPPRRYFDSGMSLVSMMAEFFDCHDETIRKIARKNGIGSSFPFRDIIGIGVKNGATVCGNRVCINGEHIAFSRSITKVFDPADVIAIGQFAPHSQTRFAMLDPAFIKKANSIIASGEEPKETPKPKKKPDPEPEPKHTTTIAADPAKTGANMMLAGFRILLKDVVMECLEERDKEKSKG